MASSGKQSAVPLPVIRSPEPSSSCRLLTSIHTRSYKRRVRILRRVVGCLAVAAAASSSHAATGFYLSMGLGANAVSALATAGTSSDRASVCDEFINPMYATVTQVTGYESYNCTGADRGLGAGWKNSFGRADGLLANIALGYRLSQRIADGPWSRLTLELEYAYRDTVYAHTARIPGATGAAGDKLAQEIVKATDRIGSVAAHHAFVNLNFGLASAGRYTPYIGIGVGAVSTEMEYASVWTRNPDPVAIVTGAGLPNADQVRDNLAGSTSSAQARLSDTLSGYQVLFGVDYALNETTTFGIRGRWVDLDAFSDWGFAWDPLRSHAPNLRRDLSEPVVGQFRTGHMEVFGLGIILKHGF